MATRRHNQNNKNKKIGENFDYFSRQFIYFFAWGMAWIV